MTCAWKWGEEEDHGSKTYRSHKDVAQKMAKGGAIHKGGCCSEKETGTDDTTETGNEGQLGRWNGGTVEQ